VENISVDEKMYKIILTITLILLGLGFVPYKFPRNPDKLSDNEIIADHEESTCSTALYVVRGKLIIPQDIKSYFPNDPTEFNIDSTGVSPFDPIDKNQGNWWLISDNEFVISGKVVGVDSSDFKYCGANYPKFKIDNWSPTKYHANFWSFSPSIFITYFLILFASLLTSIVFLFVRKPWKSKT
jgi:hypothetical protein